MCLRAHQQEARIAKLGARAGRFTKLRLGTAWTSDLGKVRGVIPDQVELCCRSPLGPYLWQHVVALVLRSLALWHAAG